MYSHILYRGGAGEDEGRREFLHKKSFGRRSGGFSKAVTAIKVSSAKKAW